MPLNKSEKEEIRAIVASEIQDVLRGEMAQWWAESVAALASQEASSGAGANQRGRQSSGGAIRRKSVGLDIEYLTEVAGRLADAHKGIARDLESNTQRLQQLLAESQEIVKRLEVVSTRPAKRG